MDVAAVMDELARALDSVEGLEKRVFAYPAPNVVPPAAFVGWPDEIDYNATMVHGAVTLTLPVLVVVGKADVRSARDTVAAYLNSSGPASVPAALEGGLRSACDSARVTSAHVAPVSIAGIEYLAALLDVAVTGRGGQ
jgi:hypothetical protein